MGWRTVVVNTHSKLSYKNNHLIFKDASRTELIHLSEVDILLFGDDGYRSLHYANQTLGG